MQSRTVWRLADEDVLAVQRGAASLRDLRGGSTIGQIGDTDQV